jgi:LmbE family N-acetylglucosaminyl deacetylase
MVIAPHPDDEVLGCGGVIRQYSAQGDEVHVVIVTRGAIDLYPEDEDDEIKQEIKDAHDVLGVAKTHFLEFPAPKLDTVPGYQLADEIAGVIRAVCPTTVYCPHRGDVHADHQRVFQATLVATRPINHCSVKQLFCYETLSETEWCPPFGDQAFVPNVFVDISASLDEKLKAMSCYQSQLQDSPKPRSLTAIEALAKLRGSTVSLPAAEAFMLIRAIF